MASPTPTLLTTASEWAFADSVSVCASISFAPLSDTVASALAIATPPNSFRLSSVLITTSKPGPASFQLLSERAFASIVTLPPLIVAPSTVTDAVVLWRSINNVNTSAGLSVALRWTSPKVSTGPVSKVDIVTPGSTVICSALIVRSLPGSVRLPLTVTSSRPSPPLTVRLVSMLSA